jgi:hypothetical protein
VALLRADVRDAKILTYRLAVGTVPSAAVLDAERVNITKGLLVEAAVRLGFM